MIFRNIQEYSEIFNNFQEYSWIFNNFQEYSGTFKNFQEKLVENCYKLLKTGKNWLKLVKSW